jgi:CubicO group peptidase (beta-lactamase class C family)
MPRSRRPHVLTLLTAVAAAIAGLAGPAGAQKAAAPTETAAARRVRELVATVSSGDSATIAHFVDTATMAPPGFPPSERVARLRQQFETTGGYVLHGVETGGQGQATALVSSRGAADWRRITVTLDTAGSGRIGRISMAPARDPGVSLPNRALGDAEIADQLGRFVQQLAKRDQFSGTVMVARNGKPVYTAAVGEANKDFRAPNRLDTKFNLGSMNKMFTAVSIAQLVEGGKLSFDDTLGKFLPAGSMRPEVLAKVRIKHLLSHTSGLGSYFNDTWDAASRARYRTVDDWMALVKDDTLAFEPGSRWSYSNTGMLVLGKVIERVTGQDYFEYVREHVYKPAGMTSSDSYDLDRVNPNLAVGYDRSFRKGGVEWRNNIFMHVIRGGPAGGGYSTVADLTRFAEALRSGKLVSKRYVDILTTPKPELNSPRYGYGFAVGVQEGVYGHNGGFPGINSDLTIYRDGGWTIAVMSNYSMAAQPVVDRAQELIGAGRKQTAAK